MTIEDLLRNTLSMNRPCECNADVVYTATDACDETCHVKVLAVYKFHADMTYTYTPVQSVEEQDNLGMRCSECGKDWSSMNMLLDASNERK